MLFLPHPLNYVKYGEKRQTKEQTWVKFIRNVLKRKDK